MMVQTYVETNRKQFIVREEVFMAVVDLKDRRNLFHSIEG